MVKLFATDGFANLASKDVKKLLEVINAVKPAVGGDMGQAVKLFGRKGFANFAAKYSIPLVDSIERFKYVFEAPTQPYLFPCLI